MKSNIVILVPHPELSGGVSNFYKVAKPYFTARIKYLYFNSGWESRLVKYLINPWVIVWVAFNIALRAFDHVVVNPSLHKNALIRDGFFLIWSKLFRKKTTVFWRGWNPDNEPLLNDKLIVFLLRRGYLKSDQHVVLNDYTQKRLVTLGVDESRIYRNSTLVDDSFFEASRKNDNSNSRFSILFLTRVEKYKGIYEALELIRLYETDYIEFHIVGDGSEIEAINNYVSSQKLENIFIHGFASGKDKIKFYLSSDIYLFPSYSEGMPNSLLEAMGAGLPVICTKVGAIADFFENNKMGFAHELPIEINTLKSSLDYFLEHSTELKRMGDYNRQFAEQHFKASTVIKKLENTLTLGQL